MAKFKRIEAIVSAKGLAFILKQRPFFEHAKITIDLDKPFSKLIPIGKNQNIAGILDGDSVRLENSNGEIIAIRNNPRQFFPFGRRLFCWDDLDMAYFANYAFWNYFTLPCLLMNDKIQWNEKSKGFLIAKFPENIPTHSTIQEFYFDGNSGQLLQHNYTVEIISKLATAANVVHSHCEKAGLVYADSRIVTPKSLSGKAFKIPILIDIKVHDFKLI